MKKLTSINKRFIIPLLLTSVSACGNGVMLVGSAEGINSFYQGQHGVIEAAKNNQGQAIVTHGTYQDKQKREPFHSLFRSLREDDRATVTLVPKTPTVVQHETISEDDRAALNNLIN